MLIFLAGLIVSLLLMVLGLGLDSLVDIELTILTTASLIPGCQITVDTLMNAII